MRDLYQRLKNNLGLSMILFIGLGVEFSNFQSMFYRFMLQYRPDWGSVNHVPAAFLSAFLLLCIVIFGIRKQWGLSWFLAMLTCVISFSVYSRMGLRWNLESLSEVHFVVLILSGMLPLVVAYTTHQMARDNDDAPAGARERQEMERLIQEIKKMQARAAQRPNAYDKEEVYREAEKKKYSHSH